jgi:hypothetical protein
MARGPGSYGLSTSVCLALTMLVASSSLAAAQDVAGTATPPKATTEVPSPIPSEGSVFELAQLNGVYQDPAEDIRQALDQVTAQTGVPNLPAARDAIIAKWKPDIDRKRRASILASYRSAFTQRDVDAALAFFH